MTEPRFAAAGGALLFSHCPPRPRQFGQRRLPARRYAEKEAPLQKWAGSTSPSVCVLITDERGICIYAPPPAPSIGELRADAGDACVADDVVELETGLLGLSALVLGIWL